MGYRIFPPTSLVRILPAEMVVYSPNNCFNFGSVAFAQIK